MEGHTDVWHEVLPRTGDRAIRPGNLAGKEPATIGRKHGKLSKVWGFVACPTNALALLDFDLARNWVQQIALKASLASIPCQGQGHTQYGTRHAGGKVSCCRPLHESTRAQMRFVIVCPAGNTAAMQKDRSLEIGHGSRSFLLLPPSTTTTTIHADS